MKKTSSKQNLREYPSRVHVELTTKCNINCIYCYRSGLSNYVQLDNQIEKILRDDLIPNCLEIELQGTGESLLYPTFDKIVESAAANNCKINLITNGLLLDKNRLEKFYNSGCNIVVSIDSANSQIYQTLRPGASFSKLMSNISYWKFLKREMSCVQNSSTLSAHMTLTSKNIEGIPSLIRLLKNFDVDGLFVSVVRRAGTDNMAWDDIQLDNRRIEVLEVLKIGSDYAKKLNFSFQSSTIYDETPFISSRSLCPSPWNHVYISANGDIFPCCSYQTSMGNCLEQSFFDIWNGSKFEKLRSTMIDGVLPEDCSKCMLPWK